MRASILLSLLSLLVFPGASMAEVDHWKQWRGTGGQGHAEAAGLPLTWSEDRNIAWKTPIPGRGWSSPVIDGDQIWMTTALETPLTDPAEIEERLKTNTGGQPLTLLEKVALRAVCVDRESGELRHDLELMVVENPQWVHKLNSYASPTPVIEAGRLYCHFGTFGTAAVDTESARVLWTNQDLPIMHENGPGSSPVLCGGLVIFHCDGSDRQFIAALHKESGKLAWRTDRSGEMHENPQLKKAYGTPVVRSAGDRAEVISGAANWLYSYHPETGEEQWKLAYGDLGFSNVARPVLGHGMIFVSTGFMRAEMLAVRPEPSPEIVWRYSRSVPKMSSPLLVGNELYFVSDQGGIVTCLDARTGEKIWQERIDAADCSASPTYGDGKIYFHGRQGLTTVLAPGREFRILAENPLDGQIMASLAVAGRALYLRTDQALYRIEEEAAAN